MDNKIRHLEMIQGIINRMANNSFVLKGWAVTLVTGIFALSAKDTNKVYFLIAYIPIIIFWILDAYYLLQERLYRSLYKKIASNNVDKTDFCMQATVKDFGSSYNSYLSCFLSKTEILFYLPLALICAIVIILAQI